jgi:hypothetical protein
MRGAGSLQVCDTFRELDTLVVLAVGLLHLLAFAVPATLGLLLLVRKEFSDGSYRARNIWMKLQVRGLDITRQGFRCESDFGLAASYRVPI